MPQKSFDEVEVRWPSICPCCGMGVDGKHRMVVSKFKQNWANMNIASPDFWEVPYCETCLHHVAVKQQRPTRSIIIEIATLLIAIIGVFSILPSNALIAGMVFIFIVIAGILGNAWVLRRHEQTVVRPAVGKDCASSGPALDYRGWDETRINHTFVFFNEAYAKEFTAINQEGKLIQVK